MGDAETMTTPMRNASQRMFNGSAKLSMPSFRLPACQITAPRYTERQALPLPSLAKIESSRELRRQSNRLSSARTREANAAADDANPAAGGTDERVFIRNRKSGLGRNRSKNSETRAAASSGNVPPGPRSSISSRLPVRGESSVSTSIPGSVTERLELNGRFNSRSLLPQYLQRAMLTDALPRPDDLAGSGARSARIHVTTSFLSVFLLMPL